MDKPLALLRIFLYCQTLLVTLFDFDSTAAGKEDNLSVPK